MNFLAHSENAAGQPHLLKDHLRSVGAKTQPFTATTNLRWAKLQNEPYCYPNLGKYCDEFQNNSLGSRLGDIATHHAIYGEALIPEATIWLPINVNFLVSQGGIAMRHYECSFEIAGPMAMFTRPDTGAAPVSYPVPTYSAAKGIFEAIVRLKSAFIRPTRVEVCAPIAYQKYTTNYGGPLRKSEAIRKGNSYQLIATVLVNVCYRIYGMVEHLASPPGDFNHLHACQDIFWRRLKRGQCYYVPCLGWKEFVPSYVGIFRDAIQPDTTINLDIPSMLFTVFDQPANGKLNPRYVQDVQIRNGVLTYAQ